MTDRPGDGVFPDGFFERQDDSDDAVFYRPPRLVTHLDDGAIAAVGDLYDELQLGPAVLDVCSSWVSHFHQAPAELVALGMNAYELERNAQATSWVVQDLNADPVLPFATGSFDDATCCVSVDYLTRPVEVFAELRRVLRSGGRLVCTWSNRCFPTKAIAGWLAAPPGTHGAIVEAYFASAGGWSPPRHQTRIPPGATGDPLWATWAQRT